MTTGVICMALGMHNEHDVVLRIQNALNAHGSALQRISADRFMRLVLSASKIKMMNN
jgi:hypothetical protein